MGDECAGFGSYFVALCPAGAVRLVRRRVRAYRQTVLYRSMPSPNSDTRAQVVVAYQGHPVFVCAQCSTVIVGRVRVVGVSLELTEVAVLRFHRHSKMS